MMYKKSLLLMFLIGCIFSINMVKADAENVYMQYCADASNATGANMRRTIVADGDEKKELCLYFNTSNEKPIKIKYDFTDSHTNTHGSQICDASTGFSKFFSDSTPDERVFNLSATNPLTIKEKITIPPGMSGMQLGCIAYYVIEDSKMATGQMFFVMLRKALPLNLFIGSSASIKSSITLLKNTGGIYTTNSKVKATVDKDNTLSLSFLIRNNGNISQNVSISGKVYNMLGVEKDFNFQQKIGPGESKEMAGNVGMLPAYKGFFTIKYTLQNTPVFDFVMEGLQEKDKAGGSQSDQAQIYIFSWITLIIILVLLALIIKVIIPRRRIQQPQQ